MQSELFGARVLVVGASGFLGARLVERLVEEHGAHVRVLVRKVMGVAPLARLPIEVCIGDILDLPSVVKAADGCSVIFNCAKGKGRDVALRRAVDIEGVRHCVAAARQTGARVVHVSTMAVYDLLQSGDIDETSAETRPGDTYADAKLEGERLALALGAQLGVAVTVMQPTVVYGPKSGVHGVEILDELRTGRVMLVNDGTGICNAVYIDDVVTALCLGATSERAAGERFLISGPEHPTWRAFYAAFERMLGVQRMVPMSEAEALALWQRSQRRETLLSLALQTVRQDAVLRQRMLATREGLVLRWAIERLPLKYLAQRAMRPRRSTAVNANVEHLPLSPLRPWLVRYLASKPRVNIEKARRVLGYEPMFELAEGMRLTESWARWAKLAP